VIDDPFSRAGQLLLGTAESSLIHHTVSRNSTRFTVCRDWRVNGLNRLATTTRITDHARERVLERVHNTP
jgi:hypothetical protein